MRSWRKSARGTFWRRFHIGSAVLWAAMSIPTLLWWKDSILWVALMSIYAIVIGHWSAAQAAEAEEKIDEMNGEG